MTKLPVLVCFIIFFPGSVWSQKEDSNYSGEMENAISKINREYLTAKKNGNQDSLFSSLGSMFNLYMTYGDYARGFDYAEQLYNIAIGTENTNDISQSLVNLGKLYYAIGDYPHALDYYSRALAMDGRSKGGSFANSLKLYIGDTYAQTARFDSAWHYYSLYERRIRADSSIYLISTGECFFLQGEYLKALESFRSVKDSVTRADSRTLLNLARVYAVLGKPQTALMYGREGLQRALMSGARQRIRDGYKIVSNVFDQMHITDSSDYYFRKYILNRDIILNAQTSGRLAALTYEQEINRMSQDNKIHEAELRTQRLIRNVLIAGLLLLAILAFLFSRYLIVSRRSETRQLKIVENELTIQKLESEKSRLDLEQQKAELEIKALRAQMNPHFIFNCLNSINRFIIRHETGKAADYLTKFAGLIRIVLEKSGASKITLAEELQALSLYMDLEALRFEFPFRYEIQCEGIDKEEILIPSLVIQPFVENSIWHGFHAGQIKQGFIRILFHLESGLLHCTILDNGIGYSRSKAHRDDHSQDRTSFGIKFTTERLQLLGAFKPDSSVRVEDLRDERGEICGTGVYLRIPAEYG